MDPLKLLHFHKSFMLTKIQSTHTKHTNDMRMHQWDLCGSSFIIFIIEWGRALWRLYKQSTMKSPLVLSGEREQVWEWFSRRSKWEQCKPIYGTQPYDESSSSPLLLLLLAVALHSPCRFQILGLVEKVVHPCNLLSFDPYAINTSLVCKTMQ